MPTMLLDGTTIVQAGCGVAGDIAGGILARLGAQVTRIVLRDCPLCGEACDGRDPWRGAYSSAKQVLEREDETDLRRYLDEHGPAADVLLFDGVSAELLERWQHGAGDSRPLSVLFTTGAGFAHGDEWESHGLCAEALSGAAGTMGPEDGPPTPFGYLFGETNVALRGVAIVVDRLAGRALHPDAATGEAPLTEVSAADACIDAMDNPWQEATLPGPVHDAPNSLTRRNYRRTGAQKAGIVPYGLFEAGDGWVCLVGTATAELIARSLGRPELLQDERFSTVEARIANRDFVIGILQEWIGGFQRGDDFVQLLGNSAVVAKAERLEDIIDDRRGLLGLDSPTAPYRITVGGIALEELDA